MNVGDVVTLRGVTYRITRIRPDGEPCLSRVEPNPRPRGGGYLDPL